MAISVHLILASKLCSLCTSQFIPWNKSEVKPVPSLMSNLQNGVRSKTTYTGQNSILIDQMDIVSDSEKFLIGSLKGTTFNGAVRYFKHGLLDCQCGINV